MMDAFTDSTPSEWQRDGIVTVRPPRSVSRKYPIRTAPWPTVLVGAAVGMMGVSAGVVRVVVSRTGAAVSASARPFAQDTSSFAGDPDIVTPEFWLRVGQYVRDLPAVPVEADVPDPDPIV